MLYNILPPIIFFTSLGGIILVTSRVIARIRNQQVTNDIKQAVAEISDGSTKKAKSIANVIGPNQKSVQFIRNRLSLFSGSIRDSVVSARTELDYKRKARSERKLESIKVKQQAQEPVAPIEGRQGSPDSIRVPNSPLRNKAYKLGLLVQNVATQSASKVSRFSKTSLAGLQDLRRKRRETKEAQQEAQFEVQEISEEQSIESEPQSRSDVINHAARPKPSVSLSISDHHEDSLESQEPSIANNRSKSPQPSNSSISIIQQASTALADNEYEKVEDIIVPYLAEHPQSTQGYMLLGKAATGRKSWEEAVEIFEQVKSIDPTTKGCYAALGQASFEAGKFTKAIEALQRAHDEEPDNIMVIECLLTIAQRMDNATMQRSLTEELAELTEQTKQPAR